MPVSTQARDESHYGYCTQPTESSGWFRKPQGQFLASLFVTLWVVCGKANFTNLSRYGDYCERTYRRHYHSKVEFIAFHCATVKAAIPSHREQIGAMDCSFIRKSGSATWGRDYFYNGSAGKAEKGLEISLIAVVDVAAHQGYTLSVAQTAQSEPTAPPEGPGPVKSVSVSARMQGYIQQLERTRPHFPSTLTHLAADSFYSKQAFVDAVIGANLHLVSKLRIDADLRYCYCGPQKPRGAPRKYDGKVDLRDLSRLQSVPHGDPHLQLYTQVVWHRSLKRQIRIVYLINRSHPDKPRVALLFSTDTALDPERLYEYYKARFHIEFIFRDAKQFTGLSDCQSRQQDALDFHFNVSLAALNLAKLEQMQSQQQSTYDAQPISFSMATYKRQTFNQHCLERFIARLDLDPTLIKSHPNYPSLLHYGALAP